MSLTEHLDLRGGEVCWPEPSSDLPVASLPADLADVAIVGAGVMGAMLAERISGQGRSVVVLDRRPPAWGATAASTARTRPVVTSASRATMSVGTTHNVQRSLRVRGTGAEDAAP